MDQEQEEIARTLESLEKQLDDIENLDPASRQRLHDTVAGIRQRLHLDEEELVEHEGLLERVRETAQEFEDSHPTLFQTLGRIIDALGQMGI